MPKKKKVLIVEDEQSLNLAYRTVLGTAGYNVKAAFDGREALDIVKDYQPSLIILDLHMPGMSGIEFLKKYQPKDGERAKVVVFSNYDMQDEIEEAYSLGADRYILKALASPKELLKIVAEP